MGSRSPFTQFALSDLAAVSAILRDMADKKRKAAHWGTDYRLRKNRKKTKSDLGQTLRAQIYSEKRMRTQTAVDNMDV